MRTLKRNKQTIQYANLLGKTPVYVRDSQGNRVVDYTDEQGNVFYQTTGDYENSYTDPTKAKVNIAFSGGEVQDQEFGVDISAYDATLVYVLNEFPITETSLIWYETTPTFVGIGEGRHVDPNSADYKVVAVKPSLNITKVLLGKLVKQ